MARVLVWPGLGASSKPAVNIAPPLLSPKLNLGLFHTKLSDMIAAPVALARPATHIVTANFISAEAEGKIRASCFV